MDVLIIEFVLYLQTPVYIVEANVGMLVLLLKLICSQKFEETYVTLSLIIVMNNKKLS